MHRKTWTTLALTIAVLLVMTAFAGAALAKNVVAAGLAKRCGSALLEHFILLVAKDKTGI